MLLNYFHIALRNFKKRPGFSILNCLGLSMGIAGGIVLFLFIYFHLQTDVHHHQAHQIYRVVLNLHLDDGSVEYESGVSLPMAEALKGDYPAVEKVAFLKEMVSPTVTVLPSAGEEAKHFIEDGAVAFANSDYFQLFSYHWLSGKASTALSEPNSVVLSQKYALKYFGETNVVGGRHKPDFLTLQRS